MTTPTFFGKLPDAGVPRPSSYVPTNVVGPFLRPGPTERKSTHLRRDFGLDPTLSAPPVVSREDGGETRLLIYVVYQVGVLRHAGVSPADRSETLRDRRLTTLVYRPKEGDGRSPGLSDPKTRA